MHWEIYTFVYEFDCHSVIIGYTPFESTEKNGFARL